MPAAAAAAAEEEEEEVLPLTEMPRPAFSVSWTGMSRVRTRRWRCGVAPVAAAAASAAEDDAVSDASDASDASDSCDGWQRIWRGSLGLDSPLSNVCKVPRKKKKGQEKQKWVK